MPLHRDIHWLGRQWAVTGHGLQLINQKQMGYYDIEAARLWEARVTEVQSKVWIDRPDFDRALELARARFIELAPADWSPATAPSPPPVRATPPAAPRAPLDAESVPSIEELLAKLKSKSAAVPSAKPAEALAPVPREPDPPGPEPLKPDPPRAEVRKAEPTRSELDKSELPKPSQPAVPVAPEGPSPEARRVEPPKVESLTVEPATSELAKPEPAEREAPEPETPKSEPIRAETRKSVVLKPEVRQMVPAQKREAPPPAPVVAVVRRPARPAWPVFERKIAGSGRFVRPWRVTSARWHGPGLPPRP